VIDIDLTSQLRLMSLGAPAMGEGAMIVNVSSMAGRVPLRAAPTTVGPRPATPRASPV